MSKTTIQTGLKKRDCLIMRNYRRISTQITKQLIKTNILPWHVTIIYIIIGFIAFASNQLYSSVISPAAVADPTDPGNGMGPGDDPPADDPVNPTEPGDDPPADDPPEDYPTPPPGVTPDSIPTVGIDFKFIR